jgi:hypothetical protein
MQRLLVAKELEILGIDVTTRIQIKKYSPLEKSLR